MSAAAQHRGVAALAAATALSVLVSLTGCSSLWRPEAPPVDPTWTYAAAMDVLREVPGVEDSFLTSGPVGLPNQIELTTGLRLTAGYPAELVPPLLDYVLAVAWSVPVKKPTTSVAAAFMAAGKSVDLQPAAAVLGWPEYPGPGLSLSPRVLAERYGAWPSHRPAVPAELAAYVPAPAAPPRASGNTLHPGRLPVSTGPVL